MELIKAVSDFSKNILDSPFREIRNTFINKFSNLLRTYSILNPKLKLNEFIQKFDRFNGDIMNIKDIEKYISLILEGVNGYNNEIKKLLCYAFSIEYNDRM